MNTPIPVLRVQSSELCAELAEQENESPDALWELFVSAEHLPLKYKKTDGESDLAALELWEAVQELKKAETAEIKRLLPA